MALIRQTSTINKIKSAASPVPTSAPTLPVQSAPKPSTPAYNNAPNSMYLKPTTTTTTNAVNNTVNSTTKLPTLADVSKQNGWSTNYDTNTGMVTVTDLNSGKALNFNNGGGQAYGLGGMDKTGGYNTVADLEKLKSYFNVTNPVQDTYGKQFDPSALQKMYEQMYQNEINAKYEAQKAEEAAKLQKLLNTYNTQKQSLTPQYDLAMSELDQQLNDQSFQARENMNKMGGTGAVGLDADLMNKLRVAAMKSKQGLSNEKLAKLAEIDTNIANAGVDSASKLASLNSQQAQDTAGVVNKSFLESLKTYNDLIGTASQVQNTKFNQQQTLRNNTRQDKIDNVDMQIKQLQLKNEEIDRQIKQIESDFKLTPEYKQSLKDSLTYQKSKNDLELKKIQADINATNALATQRNTPGAKPTQTQRTNQSMSEDYNSLKNMPVNNAVDELLSGRADYIAAYGISGFKQLWDTVLADAIRAGQAKPYSEYFKDQSLEY